MTAPTPREPHLAIVLITDRLATIRRVLDHLSRQTRRDVVELVIAHTPDTNIDISTELFAGFAAVRLVPVPSLFPMAAARAAVVRAVTAPLVFLGETHSFVHPTFVEEVLRAHDGTCDVVVPGFDNANPGSALSWAAFLADYGAWLHHQAPGFIAGGPIWNVAYSREALRDADDVLEAALGHGTILGIRLRAHGRRVRFAPSARIDHANVATPREWVHERFLSGLLVASHRRTDWSLARRLAYVAASPLIPLVTLSRIRQPFTIAWRQGLLPRGTAVALVLGACIRTVGEIVGYVSTPGPQFEVDMELHYELHKMKHARGG
ncbi:MAG: glycosyltransferase [Gemmatimonadaceae bacterium]|nr:glycosyltransferase [Gemmatimonadaceae bacterium]